MIGDKKLQRLLVCPISKQHLLPASEALTQKLLDQEQAAIQPDESANKLGSIAFLITANKRWAYPVIDGVPYLIENRRIRLEGV